jgi:hypothetical protein
MPVVIESGEWIYYTTLKQWELPYDEGKVLYVQIDKRNVLDNQRDSTMVAV